MDNSIFLAKAFGLYFLIIGLALLIRGQQLQPALRDFAESKGLYVFGAVLTVILGIILVLSHNIWVANWTVLVTIFCWMVLITGILRLFFVEELRVKAASCLSHPKIALFGIVPLMLAAIFLYLGFCPAY